jgi:manganese efflux pump family protein
VGIATLVAWVLTAGLGGYMLRSLIARGGVRQQRVAREGLPPVVLFAHFGLAGTGLLVWITYLAAGQRWLAWLAVGVLMPAIGLGISTVTLWTPYPGPAAAPAPGATAFTTPGEAASTTPAETASTTSGETGATMPGVADPPSDRFIDDLVAHLLAEPPRTGPMPRLRLSALIPVGHGLAATATFLLAVLTATGTR